MNNKTVLFFSLMALTVGPQVAQGLQHFMQIYQVIGGVDGDATAQAIELRMRLALQNALTPVRIRAWDAQGNNPVVVIDFASPVPNHGLDVRILIASANFANYTCAIPDFTMTNLIPQSYLAAGSLTFETDAGTLIYWRLSWGGGGYTGSTTGDLTNDADGEFGPPFPGPLPSGTGQALQFQGAAAALSTNNAADYALTAGAAVFTNNTPASFTVMTPAVECCEVGDCNDGVGCTDDDCVNFSCEFLANNANCPDNTLFCDGTEFCDDLLDCQSTGDPCVLGQVCNEGTNTCDVDRITIKLEVVADGLTAPVGLTHAGDGSGRLFVVDQAGQIRIIENGSLLATPFLDIASKLPTLGTIFDERGLLGLAFHPDYANNGRFFIRYSVPRVGDKSEPCFTATFVVGCHSEVLAEYSVSGGNPNVADAGSEMILFSVDEPQFNHDGGELAFGPDGFLYWTLGDGGGAHDGLADIPPSHGTGHGQNTDTALGSILRVDIDGTFPYDIPVDNPFADGVDGLPEIYAYGLRNPYKFSFDDGPGGDGTLYLADVGQALFEEVNVIINGGNYGWVIREGLHCFDPFAPGDPPDICASVGPLFGEPLLDPINEYLHPLPCAIPEDCAAFGVDCGANGLCENEGGISVIGGFVYRGSQFADLVGKYVYGDFSAEFSVPLGRLYYFDLTGPEALERKQFLITPADDPLDKFVKGFGEDEAGEVYVLVSDDLPPSGTSGSVLHIAECNEISYGDMDRNGVVDVFDLFCLINAFSNDFPICSLEDTDIDPCGGNGIIDVFDLFALINAFSGQFACPATCE